MSHLPINGPSAKSVPEIVDAVQNGRVPQVDDKEVGLLEGLKLFENSFDPLTEKLLDALQEYLRRIEGQESFATGDEMRVFARQLMTVIDRIGGRKLGVAVPSGVHTDEVGRLIVVKSGPKKEDIFCIRLPKGLALLHANGKRIPKLTIATRSVN